MANYVTTEQVRLALVDQGLLEETILTIVAAAVTSWIDAQGVRQSIEAQTVNGPISATSLAAGSGASISLESVNGQITLVLPKNAQFSLSTETMNGTISSTFPLPPLACVEAAVAAGRL